jgi:23S rRNA U2552 (ribose-2'-O)-methylase RlmE/FtsJ
MLRPSIQIKLRDSKNSFNYKLSKFHPQTQQEKDLEGIFFRTDERDALNQKKNMINQQHSTKEWDKAKKLTNPYELIHIPNRKIKSESISRYDPLSRSFFKLWELINHFDLIRDRSPITTAHLAEGPGGFLEAVLFFRQRIIKIYPLQDHYYGITLNPYSKEIPGWNKASGIIKQYRKNIEIDYGIDQTGDLYKVQNIRSFSDKVINNNNDNSNSNSNGAELVTADGGFDFSVDFNQQEQLAHRLIIAQLITGIRSQKMGGSLICKFFDTYTYVSAELLYFVSCLYEEVNLVKPQTSRPANSEKYLVAIGYKGFPNKNSENYYLKQMENLLDQWDEINNKGLVIKSIFDHPPQFFMDLLGLYNSASYKQQIAYVDYTLNIIKNKPDWKQMEMILDFQVKKATEWCQYYHLSVNLESYFYQKYLHRLKIKNDSNYKPSQTYLNYLNGLDQYFENFVGYQDTYQETHLDTYLDTHYENIISFND